MTSTVQAVSLSPTHGFSKFPQPSIRLLAGLGVEGDAHAGATVQHLFHRRRDPHRPNLSQVHLIQAELFRDPDFLPLAINPGDMGENITTADLDLLHLPVGTRLHLGPAAVVELTGLRTPCVQMDRFRPGLMAASFLVTGDAKPAPRAGVMSVVVVGGVVHPGDPVCVTLPPGPPRPLRRI